MNKWSLLEVSRGLMAVALVYVLLGSSDVMAGNHMNENAFDNANCNASFLGCDNETSDNETSDNETSDNETSDNGTSDNETGGNETGGNETGGNETGGNETGGNETGGTGTTYDFPVEDTTPTRSNNGSRNLVLVALLWLLFADDDEQPENLQVTHKGDTSSISYSIAF